MSKIVAASFENAERNRCIDIFVRADGTYGFEEWRREPEDPGTWHLLSYDSRGIFASEADAIATAKTQVDWFGAEHDAPQWSQ